MNHDSSIRRSTGQLGKHRGVGAVCAALAVLALMTAISLGSFEAPAAAPRITAIAADAPAPSVISYEEPVPASVGFPVECSQVPSGVDCLYY
jgi:hypothetical protein